MDNQISKTHSCRNPSARFSRSISADAATGTMCRLPVRSNPKPDESFIGYLVRLTEENGYDTPSWILRHAGIDYWHIRNRAIVFKPTQQLSRLATLTDNEISALAALVYPPANLPDREDVILFSGAPLYKFLIRADTPRVCPDCLHEFGYCRRIWDLVLVTACPLHRRLLLDKCPKCRSYLPVKRNSVSICLCGYDYRNAESRTVTEDELALTKQVHLLCKLPVPKLSKPRQISPVQDLNLSDLATLMVFVCGQYQGLLTTAGRRLFKSQTNEELHEAFFKTYSTFNEWPHRFYEFLDWRQRQDENCRASDRPLKSGLGRHFGTFYHGLYNILSSPSLEFMRTAFSDYVTTYWQGGYISKAGWGKRHSQHQGRANYLTRIEARRQLRVTVEYIDHLVSTGYLKAVVRQTGKKRMFLIDAESLDEARRAHEGTLSVLQAAEKLNVSDRIVIHLASNGCISPLRSPKLSEFKSWRIHKESIDELLNNLRQKISPRSKSVAGSRISMEVAIRKLSCCRIGLASFIKFILEDKFKPYGQDTTKTGVYRFMFRSEDIDIYPKPFFAWKMRLPDRKTSKSEMDFIKFLDEFSAADQE